MEIIFRGVVNFPRRGRETLRRACQSVGARVFAARIINVARAVASQFSFNCIYEEVFGIFVYRAIEGLSKVPFSSECVRHWEELDAKFRFIDTR